MVNVSIDVTDLGGEARPGDKVVFWRPRMGGSATHAGRVISTAPVTVFLTGGKATVSDVEPGEMTVLLQCRGVESQGPVTVGVPDGDHTVTLRALLESQFEYAPPIVSAVQEAAANASASERAAIEAQVRSEAAADRADAKVDDAINNGANLIRNEVKQDADRAVSARQAATQSESKAKASEGKAASSASNAKTSETNAKQSETNAGDYAAVATTAATEAVDAMESASGAVSTIGDSVTVAAGHADRAAQHESNASTYAQTASDAADRVGTAEQIGTWARQAQSAADRIGTAEQVEGWADSAHDSADAAAQSESSARQAEAGATSAAASAKTSETNSKTYEANARSAADRAEFAAEETIQQVEGDFATRNYVDNTIANALRVDTTVGTRIFAGNVMIHGDTGLRRINDLATGLDFSTSTLYKAVIYRVGYEVHLSAIGLSLGIQNITENLPYGFRPIAGTYHSHLGSMYQSGQILSVGNPSSTNRISVVAPPRVGVGVALRVSWRTADPWPTTLPGIPD